MRSHSLPYFPHANGAEKKERKSNSDCGALQADEHS
jgi:hypothetical protein